MASEALVGLELGLGTVIDQNYSPQHSPSNFWKSSTLAGHGRSNILCLSVFHFPSHVIGPAPALSQDSKESRGAGELCGEGSLYFGEVAERLLPPGRSQPCESVVWPPQP